MTSDCCFLFLADDPTAESWPKEKMDRFVDCALKNHIKDRTENSLRLQTKYYEASIRVLLSAHQLSGDTSFEDVEVSTAQALVVVLPYSVAAKSTEEAKKVVDKLIDSRAVLDGGIDQTCLLICLPNKDCSLVEVSSQIDVLLAWSCTRGIELVYPDDEYQNESDIYDRVRDALLATRWTSLEMVGNLSKSNTKDRALDKSLDKSKETEVDGDDIEALIQTVTSFRNSKSGEMSDADRKSRAAQISMQIAKCFLDEDGDDDDLVL